MKSSKVIRGKPSYYYRGMRYLEMPEKTVIKKVVYNEDENKSYVYCKKPSSFLEVFCILIVVACVLVNRLYLHHQSNEIRYNSVSYYYDGYLYLNIYNEDGNRMSVNVSVLDEDVLIYEKELNPGEYLIRIPVEEIKQSYSIEFGYDTLFGYNINMVYINVLIRGDITNE